MSMSQIIPPSGLPDPALHGTFYDDVALKRFFAWVIDVILISLITLILIPLTAFTALFFLAGLFMAVGFLYRTISLTRASATPGMRLMAIEFRTFRGEAFDLGTAILHTLGYMLSISFGLPQLISVVTILITPRRQSLTDMVLGSAAINRAARY